VWKRSLTSSQNAYIWKQLIFPKNPMKHAVPKSSLSKLVSYSGNDVRRLVIYDTKGFWLTRYKLDVLLQGARNLEYLELHRQPPEPNWLPEQLPSLPRLTHLILDVPNCKSTLVDRLGRNLVHLHIMQNDPRVPGAYPNGLASLPGMPALRFFRFDERNGVSSDVSLVSSPFILMI
jgi:hypothetical protein